MRSAKQSSPKQSDMNTTHHTLTVGDLCERWRVSRWTLHRMRREGRGPAYLVIEVGDRTSIRYLLSSVEQFEEDQKCNK